MAAPDGPAAPPVPPSETGPPPPPLSPRTVCPVCRVPPGDDVVTRVRPCGHAGCCECLAAWAESRREPTCPICLGPMLGLRRDADGADVPVTPCVRPPSADEAHDIAGGTDHAFVLDEARALLRRVQSASRSIYRDAYGSGRRGSGVADACVAALADVERNAQALAAVAASPHPFDAAAALRRLYSLDDATRAAQEAARAGTAPSPGSVALGEQRGATGGDEYNSDGGGGGSHAPPPHVFDLGAALEAARASGGRRRRSR